MYAEFDKIGLDHDLVQMLPPPVSKTKAQRLMTAADLLIVTGSRNNVHRAYSSGTPALGVGAGNVSVIVDETADLDDAATKICASKTFDNATSCSSENALVVVKSILDPFIAALHKVGGRLLKGDNEHKLKEALFRHGKLNPRILAQDIDQVINAANLDIPPTDGVKFLIIEGGGIGPEYPESGEKLSLVTTLYRADDFEHAKHIANDLLYHAGAGHSVGIHTKIDQRAIQLGADLPTCRVIVNQAHCFATGGSFDNGMPFSLSMGCGSWGGNSIGENVNHTHLMNITRVVRTIPAAEPSLKRRIQHVLARSWQMKPPFFEHATDIGGQSGTSIRQLIDYRAQTAPESIFLVDAESNETITYASLQSRAAAVSAHMASLGAKPGDTVAYALNNSPFSAIAILGLYVRRVHSNIH